MAMGEGGWSSVVSWCPIGCTVPEGVGRKASESTALALSAEKGDRPMGERGGESVVVSLDGDEDKENGKGRSIAWRIPASRLSSSTPDVVCGFVSVAQRIVGEGGECGFCFASVEYGGGEDTGGVVLVTERSGRVVALRGRG